MLHGRLLADEVTDAGEQATVEHCDGEDLSRVQHLARRADVCIVVAGYTHEDEGEYIPGDMTLDAAAGGKALGGERDALTLRESDETTIEAAAAENERTVVVLVGGSAAMIERWSERVASVLMLCYAGMEAGTALARLLFGETCPSGKLPFSIPTDAAHLPYFDKNVDRIEYGRYHG